MSGSEVMSTDVTLGAGVGVPMADPARLVPAALVAVTSTVYCVPLVSPPTSNSFNAFAALKPVSVHIDQVDSAPAVSLYR